MTRTWKKLDGISHFHLSWSFKGHTKYIRRCMSKQNLDLNTKLALSKGFVVTVESKEKSRLKENITTKGYDCMTRSLVGISNKRSNGEKK